ncbi:hypothetical protein N0V86_007783 [Didymella sp. IMI 355093]|nr:hypothetical protein N0V86_007783 [Didymella sp. IMI 355093]
MSMYTNNIEAIAARVRDEYGAELAPLQNDYQRLDIWLTGWRSELLPESKRSWVHAFVRIAVMAVNSATERKGRKELEKQQQQQTPPA